ncbi:PREDICTED: probable anion transporter 3, chloroplastic [Camelina sativa]|uniref:Probable anion transporter 3, chloroplastic n=1 Tax=Camelina sativa TaxID=90675 RepID=A0ABM0ZKP6_CAMSA|nr:PREDICTED: probable anion transporter 3, chloroplastic [Camelina sativa]
MAVTSLVIPLQHSSCLLSFRRNPILSKKALVPVGFEARKNHTQRDNIRSAWQVKGKRRGEAVVAAAKKKRNQSPERCAAEGVTIGGGETDAIPMMPERIKVVILMACMMCLCNADRVVMSVAVVPLAEKLAWSSSFLGVVQSSFLWGYIFSSVIGGALVDRYGGKRVLAWGVALWSLATILTPWAATHSTLALLCVRTFFGLAQGVALPSMTTILSRWFPTDERASAVGISMAGFHMGNVAGLLLAPLLLSSIGISGPFILFASLGLLWTSSWSSGVTNNPQDSRFITGSELSLIQAGKPVDPPTNPDPPVRLLFSKMPTWAIIIANVTNNWGYFVLLSWMPVYFQTVFNVNLKQAAWFSAVPWAAMAVTSYYAGAASDFMIRTGHSVTFVRKVMQSIGFMGPGLSLLCLNYAKTPTCAAVFMTIALSLSSFSQAGFLLNMQDIAPQYAGFLHGISNCVGTFAAIVSTIGTGYFVQWLGSFQAFLTLTAVLYFATTVFWIVFATGERVF